MRKYFQVIYSKVIKGEQPDLQSVLLLDNDDKKCYTEYVNKKRTEEAYGYVF